MYEKILVPLDGSELAEDVLIYARELAWKLGLDIILLHVCVPEEQGMAPMHQVYVERMADIVKQRLEELQQKTGIEPPGAKAGGVRGALAVGYPAEEILSYANDNNVDLILMATHGRSGIKRWALGNVASKVLHDSDIPIWLVRAGGPKAIPYNKWPIGTLLVTLDGSDLAESVLPHVKTLATQEGAEPVDVVLLRVCEPLVVPSDYAEVLMPQAWQNLEQDLAKCRHVDEQYLKGIEKQLGDAGVHVRSEVLVGKPADEIVDYANRNSFDLIAMSTHGRSGLSRWTFGSVADRVLHGVSSPIFLVRPR